MGAAPGQQAACFSAALSSRSAGPRWETRTEKEAVIAEEEGRPFPLARRQRQPAQRHWGLRQGGPQKVKSEFKKKMIWALE